MSPPASGNQPQTQVHCNVVNHENRLERVEECTIKLTVEMQRLTSTFDGWARELKQLIEDHSNDIQSHTTELHGVGNEAGIRSRLMLVERDMRIQKKITATIGTALLGVVIEILRTMLLGK